MAKPADAPIIIGVQYRFPGDTRGPKVIVLPAADATKRRERKPRKPKKPPAHDPRQLDLFTTSEGD